ncbi:MAG TPA: DUF1801 domain-containing protein, partial [Propionibacteriaceae bacterium]|nr:DUF1801 domain-containing protein [Propionibacteriaceae bacterium]
KAAKSAQEDLDAVLAKIGEMDEPDRTVATRLHEIALEIEPALGVRLWYGSPAYYHQGGLLFFFQDRGKFKTRYATLGFSDKAALDDGGMWPSSYAVAELTPAVERQIAELIRRALG